MESEEFTNLVKNLNSKTKIIPIESDSNRRNNPKTTLNPRKFLQEHDKSMNPQENLMRPEDPNHPVEVMKLFVVRKAR